MAFPYTQLANSRSAVSFSFDNASNEKVGLSFINLLTLDDYPSEKPNIVFQTRNVTQTFVQTIDLMLSNFGALIGSSSISECMLLKYGLDRGFNPFNNATDLFPMTRCTKHGNIAVLPLGYASIFPEYTRTIHRHPVFKIVHSFDDCILEFPPEEENIEAQNCLLCDRIITKEKDIFMYRGNPFCSTDCRNDAVIAHCLYDKTMESIDREAGEGTSGSNIGADSLFTIAA